MMKEEDKRTTLFDCTKAVDEYIQKADWRIKANSNVSYSHPGMINNLAGKAIANYWLDNVYSEELSNLHRSGAIHIHDLDCLAPYCAGHDLQRLLTEGFNGVEGRVSSKPAKHFREALGQMANFIGILQGEWAGAQAFSSFDTLLAPYVFFDIYYTGLSYTDIKKAILQFIYNLNVPSRWGQCPFSNLTLDRVVPKDMRDQYPMRGEEQYFVSIFKDYIIEHKEYINGAMENLLTEVYFRLREFDDITGTDINLQKFLEDVQDNEKLLEYFSMLTYKHFNQEMGIIIKAFYECLNEGDILGQPFTFPIPTVNITEDFEWDGEISDIIFENAAKYGSSYFQNFIGSQYIKDPTTGELITDPNAYRPDDVRSMCPLSLDTEIRTNNGIKQLKDLDPDKDKVYNSFCGNRSGKLVSFTKTPIFTDHNVLKITFSDGSIVKMSEHHDQPIWNGREYTIKASELKINDIILSIKKEDNKAYFVRVTDIENIGVEPVQCITLDTNDDPYFILGNGIVTSNCRLQLDKRALRKKGGGLFGSDAQTGSIGNITFNMPRLGYLHKGNYDALIKSLDEYIDLAVEGHEDKRKFVTELNERGFFPYTRRWVKTFDTFFSTIGLNGMNEMVRNFTNDEHDITDEYGQKMCKDIMDHIRERLIEIQEKTDHLYNLEASPGEGTVRRFAASDHEMYPDIIQAGDGTGVPYYTNSAQLPVDFSDDVFAALDLQDELQQKWTGGTVFHVYTNERMTTDTCKALVKKILSNYRLPYISITPTLCICPIHGRLEGYHEYCPICDKELIRQHAEEVDINK